jgi:hypothetical protein
VRPNLRQLCREQVIAAKDRAKWLSRKRNIDGEVRYRKATMAEWMLIWLGDPALFPAWVDALTRTHCFWIISSRRRRAQLVLEDDLLGSSA